MTVGAWWAWLDSTWMAPASGIYDILPGGRRLLEGLPVGKVIFVMVLQGVLARTGKFGGCFLTERTIQVSTWLRA